MAKKSGNNKKSILIESKIIPVNEEIYDEPVEFHSQMNTMKSTNPRIINIETSEITPMSSSKNSTKKIENKKSRVGRPRTCTKIPKGAADRGTKEGEIRYTAILNEDQLLQMRQIAARENLKIKDVFNIAIEAFIKEYNSKYKEPESTKS